MHAEPAEQFEQTPAAQTLFVPQAVPLGALPDSMQTGLPVLQAVVPLLHGLPGTGQSAPTMQDVHVPLPSHTMSVPHAVPAAMLVFASVHAIDGVQTCVPLWHLLVGWQDAFAWQAAQDPPWQTIPVPHAVPFGLLSVSVQTGAPVVQTMVPTRHGLPLTSQAMSAMQVSQLPLWQTLSVSQAVPFACSVDSSMHDMTPSMQTNMPL
jgi:hypothetical protein